MTNRQTAEELRGQKFPVLDHGHVVFMDHMGSDPDIVQAARTSYQTGTTHTSDNSTLLRYLMRHRHSSPFESATIKLHIKLPIVVERQMARHRTAGWNEVSGRYSELPDECYLPKHQDVCYQSSTNRQGGTEPLDNDQTTFFLDRQREVQQLAHRYYQHDLDNGVARETARNSLPLSTYTEKVWWINLHNMLHFLCLRMDHHAQNEIRQYANTIGREIVAKLFPDTWEAFLDYRLFAMQLSSTDIGVIEAVMSIHREVGDSGVPPRSSWMEQMPERWKPARCRERDEFFAKIERLGLLVDNNE
jgi:thymidylate synthase (FAD)